MSDNINWPLNPTEGDNFTSSSGKIWWWNGCGWIGTCCPPPEIIPPCDPIDGIYTIIELEYSRNLSFSVFSNFSYAGNDQWTTDFYAGNDQWTTDFQGIFSQIFNGVIIWDSVENRWEWWNSAIGSIIGYSTSSDLIGVWEVNPDLDFPVLKVEVVCGKREYLCIEYTSYSQTYSTTGVPASFGSATSDTIPEAYIMNEKMVILYDSIGSQWIGTTNPDNPNDYIFATINGSLETPPVGEWTILDHPEGINTFSTTIESCCDTALSGLRFRIPTIDIEGEAECNLSPDGTDNYTGTLLGQSIQVTFNLLSSKWELFRDFIKISESDSLLGEWTIDGEQINFICGSNYPPNVIIDQNYGFALTPIYSIGEVIPYAYFGKNQGSDFLLIKDNFGNWTIQQ